MRILLIGHEPSEGRSVREALADGRPTVTVEDHSVSGGFSSAVLETAQSLGLDATGVTILGMPADQFIAHGPRDVQLAECGIDASGIAAAVREAIGEAAATLFADRKRPVRMGKLAG